MANNRAGINKLTDNNDIELAEAWYDIEEWGALQKFNEARTMEHIIWAGGLVEEGKEPPAIEIETTVFNLDQSMGYRKYPMAAKETINIAESKRVSAGTKVLVYPGPGEDAIMAIVTKVDELTGLIVEVSFKDENKKVKFLTVKNEIVTLIPLFYSIGKWIRSLFK